MNARQDPLDDLAHRERIVDELLVHVAHSADVSLVRAELATRLPLHVLSLAADADTRVVVRGEGEPLQGKGPGANATLAAFTDPQQRTVYLRASHPLAAAHAFGLVVAYVADGTWGVATRDLSHAERRPRKALVSALDLAIADGYARFDPQDPRTMVDPREFFAESFAAYHGAARRPTESGWEALAASDLHPAAHTLVEDYLTYSLDRHLDWPLEREPVRERAAVEIEISL